MFSPLLLLLLLLSAVTTGHSPTGMGYVESALKDRHYSYYSMPWNEDLAKTARSIRDRQLALLSHLHLLGEVTKDSISYLGRERWLLTMYRVPVAVKEFADDYMGSKSRILGYLIEKHYMVQPRLGCATLFRSGGFGKIFCVYRF